MTDPVPPVQSLALPQDAIVIPYDGALDGMYEHGFAKFAYNLPGSARLGPAGAELILHYSTRLKPGYMYLVLRWPLVAWNIVTNRTTVCKAMILVDQNASGRRDVYTSDSIAVADKFFNGL